MPRNQESPPRLSDPVRQANAPQFPFSSFMAIHLVPFQQSQKMVEALKRAGGSAKLIVKKGGGRR
jgi:hypothetical protein